jgi:uncharacterized membrane protein YobD (UPF0266 family)
MQAGLPIRTRLFKKHYKKAFGIIDSLDVSGEKRNRMTEILQKSTNGIIIGKESKKDEAPAEICEITTKITSVFPFLLTLAYLFFTKTAISPLKNRGFLCGNVYIRSDGDNHKQLCGHEKKPPDAAIHP